MEEVIWRHIVLAQLSRYKYTTYHSASLAEQHRLVLQLCLYRPWTEPYGGRYLATLTTKRDLLLWVRSFANMRRVDGSKAWSRVERVCLTERPEPALKHYPEIFSCFMYQSMHWVCIMLYGTWLRNTQKSSSGGTICIHKQCKSYIHSFK